MVTMVALIALIVVVVALLLAAWGLRRRSAEDVHSVEGYRHALDTLDDMRRGARSSVRVLPPHSDAPEDEREADRVGAEEDDPGPPGRVWASYREGDEAPQEGHEPLHREPVRQDPIPWESLQPGREYDEPLVARPAHASSTGSDTGTAAQQAGSEPGRARHEMASPPAAAQSESARASIVRISEPGTGSEGERSEPGRDPSSTPEGPIRIDPDGGNEAGLGFHPSGPERNNGGSRLVFDDMRGARGSGPPPVDQDLVPPSRRDRAVSRMNHRPRRPIIPIAAIVVAGLAVVAVIVYAVTSSGSPSGSHNASGNQHSPSTQHTATTQGTSTTAHSGTGSHSSHTSTTPTTAPKSLVTVSGTPSAGTYSVPGPTYTVTLTVTSGECWVQATSQDTGSALFTGLIAPGTPQVLQASGVTVLDIGAPHSLQVSVNGVPATYPAGFLTPFNMTLQPTA